MGFDRAQGGSQVWQPGGWAMQRAQGGPGDSLLQNLVAFWNLEEASGTRVDASGNGNDLTDINTVGQAAGIVGNAASFVAANNERLQVSNLVLGGGSYTVTYWVRFDTIASNQFQVDKTDGLAISNLNFACDYVNADNAFTFQVGDGLGGEQTIKANTFGSASTGVFYFVAAWVDLVANTINVEINASALDSAALLITPQDSVQPFTIGSLPQGVLSLDGRMDAVGVWSKALTAADRQRLYNGGAGLEHPF